MVDIFKSNILCGYMFLPATWVFLHILSNLPQASAIGCFVCTSINGSEPDCEDTFNNTGRFYRQECFSGRKGRSGLFPGTECIKMKAKHGNGKTLLVRQCVVDNGQVNSESEIGRVDHCGFVNELVFDNETVRGCILTCDTDGCNTGSQIIPMAGLHICSYITVGIFTLQWMIL